MNDSNVLRTLAGCLVVIVMWSVATSDARANPLVGVWKPAANQSNPRARALQEKLGELEITPTHIAAFGERPDPYVYEQDGQIFRIRTDTAKSGSLDLILRDPNTLVMRLPNNIDIVWERVAGDGATAQGPEAGSGSQSRMTEFVQAQMPYALPTRFEASGKSLNVLLGEGWSLDSANGNVAGLTMLLSRGGQHIVCMVIPEPDNGQRALSDCRLLD